MASDNSTLAVLVAIQQELAAMRNTHMLLVQMTDKMRTTFIWWVGGLILMIVLACSSHEGAVTKLVEAVNSIQRSISYLTSCVEKTHDALILAKR